MNLYACLGLGREDAKKAAAARSRSPLSEDNAGVRENTKGVVTPENKIMNTKRVQK